MIKYSIQYFLPTFCWLLIGIRCQLQKDSDDLDDEDGFIKHFFNSDNPDEFQKPKIPLRMGIWMGLVLGVFVLMAVGVCCGLFCKYSGKLATSSEVASPIPIVVTPPSRTPTVGSFFESGYTNHGYGDATGQNIAQCCASVTPPDSPGSTRDVLPMYTDLARSNEMNASFKRIVKGKLETPPPFYITVSPFK